MKKVITLLALFSCISNLHAQLFWSPSALVLCSPNIACLHEKCDRSLTVQGSFDHLELSASCSPARHLKAIANTYLSFTGTEMMQLGAGTYINGKKRGLEVIGGLGVGTRNIKQDFPVFFAGDLFSTAIISSRFTDAFLQLNYHKQYNERWSRTLTVQCSRYFFQHFSYCDKENEGHGVPYEDVYQFQKKYQDVLLVSFSLERRFEEGLAFIQPGFQRGFDLATTAERFYQNNLLAGTFTEGGSGFVGKSFSHTFLNAGVIANLDGKAWSNILKVIKHLVGHPERETQMF